MTTKPLNEPELIDVLQSLKQDIFKSLNCVKIGKINSFDQTKKTATIQILFKRVMPDKVISYPLLVDCPVFTLQGGGGAIQMPIQAGDPCIVLFADRNIDNWYSNGSEAAPADLRCHHLNDGLAIVGINALTSTLPAYDANVNITIPTRKKLVVSGTTATAEIFGSQLLALKADVDDIVAKFNAHTHATAATGPASTPNNAGTITITGTTKLKGA
jgi:hypothetical protein